MFHVKQFDVLVIGGGHAGVEAATAAARMGANTALVTHREDRIGEMSCNPAMGGLGKGHLIREVDALDGLIGKIADRGAIQYRLLNRSKGEAVQGPRSQIDRNIFKSEMRKEIAQYKLLTTIEAAVEEIIFKGHTACGVITQNGLEIFGKSIVLTAGTFLRGVIHRGEERIEAGRIGDNSAKGLGNQLLSLGLTTGRLKTGTPPRLLKSSINWDSLEKQEADSEPEYLSFLTDKTWSKQISCAIVHTNMNTHEIIHNNLHRSSMYMGNIEGTGPRYCPSIEDKITRFADKTSHQVFLEPETLDGRLLYPNGLSTSLPSSVQDEYIRSIQGLEKAEIEQYGYAIEYDYFDPQQLNTDLSVKSYNSLFFAGQINGTTGYEEAAAQGLVAGQAAAAEVLNKEKIEFTRVNSYIGVMISDLISRGVTEPYRMFTSRAEYRLSIRADNADMRLTQQGYDVGLVSKNRYTKFTTKQSQIYDLQKELEAIKLTPSELEQYGISTKKDGQRRSLYTLLAFQNVDMERLKLLKLINFSFDSIAKAVEISARYAPYIERQNDDVKNYQNLLKSKIPTDFSYLDISGLSSELIEKLSEKNPANLAIANDIEGMTPAAISLIAAHLRKISKSA